MDLKEKAWLAEAIEDVSLDRLFTSARSFNGWLSGEVTEQALRQIYDLMKWGPTSMNTQPGRLVFLRSWAAKERLRPHLAPTNVDKTMTAPVVAIIGYDVEFYRHLPDIFPHLPTATRYYEGKPDLIHATAFRNGTLQGAYLMIAARAVGLDCGPMSGFDNEGVDREFFAGSSLRSNFLCGIGRGDPAKVFSRSPRFSFEQSCQIL